MIARMLLCSGLVMLLVGATPEVTHALGEPVDVDGFRVTLLSVSALSAAELETRHGKATDGRRMVWLVEPREGQRGQPVLGEVRMIVAGRQYNPVTNATSSKPFSPDLVIHDFPKFAAEHATLLGSKPLTPRGHSAIVEVLIRGAALKSNDLQRAELELGVFAGAEPTPQTAPRFQWCSVSLGSK
jgi:hypothetical protein